MCVHTELVYIDLGRFFRSLLQLQSLKTFDRKSYVETFLGQDMSRSEVCNFGSEKTQKSLVTVGEYFSHLDEFPRKFGKFK
jgi:hypothetical protein